MKHANLMPEFIKFERGISVKDKNQTQPKGITKRPCKDQIFLQSITKDKTD